MSGGQHIALQVTRASSKYAPLRRASIPPVRARRAGPDLCGAEHRTCRDKLCLHSHDLSQSISNRSGPGVAGGYPNPPAAYRLPRHRGPAAPPPFPAPAPPRSRRAPPTPSGASSAAAISTGSASPSATPTSPTPTICGSTCPPTLLATSQSGGTDLGLTNRSIMPLVDDFIAVPMTFTAPTSVVNFSIASASANHNTARADVGSGSGVGCQYTHWNAQLEVGSSSSPVISGSTAEVRLADSLAVLEAPPEAASITSLAGGGSHTIAPGAPFVFDKPTVTRLIGVP